MKVTSVSKFRDWWTPNSDLQCTNVHCPWARFAGCSYRRHIRLAGFTVYPQLHRYPIHSLKSKTELEDAHELFPSIERGITI